MFAIYLDRHYYTNRHGRRLVSLHAQIARPQVFTCCCCDKEFAINVPDGVNVHGSPICDECMAH